MKKTYVTFEAEVLTLENEDVLTTSTGVMTDTTTGDNGVWFPGQGGTQWN